MLNDPQSITIGATTHSLPRVSIAGRNSTYANADDTVSLVINQATTKAGRKRHEERFTWSKVVVDPISTANDSESTSISFVIDRPAYGFSMADIESFVTAVKNHLTSGVVQSLYGGQS